LRNLGLDPPSPVDAYYDWPGRFSPFKSQRETVPFLVANNRAYCLDDLGTGKTMSALWAFDALRKEGSAGRMLVVAPLSTLQRTWADAVFKDFPHLSAVLLHGSRERRLALLALPADVYIINHDGVKVILKDLIARQDIDTLLIDELAQCARNATTDRWKVLKQLVAGRARAWGMTGKPTPHAPTDAWAQCRLLTPQTVPPFVSHFRAKTMYQVAQHIWKKKDGWQEVVHQAMQPSIRHRRDECVDLPPAMYETREVHLTRDQARMYKEMQETYYTEYRGGQVTAANAAVKATKLIQIACGAVIGETGEPVFVLPKSRLDAVEELIEQAVGKVIVYVPFTAALRQIERELSKRHTVALINGSVPRGQRDRIFGDFQDRPDPRVLVAHPGAMSHGVTLTAASVITWFAPPPSADVFMQANGRITRPGQKNSQLIVCISGTDVEARRYERVRGQVNDQDSLLELFGDRL
jgi:SNF2 family DNA or RNA helicase